MLAENWTVALWQMCNRGNASEEWVGESLPLILLPKYYRKAITQLPATPQQAQVGMATRDGQRSCQVGTKTRHPMDHSTGV